MPLVGNLLSYVPMRAVIVFTLFRLWSRPELKTAAGRIGAAAVAGESVLGLARNFFIVKQVLSYPPQFWHVVIAGSRGSFS